LDFRRPTPADGWTLLDSFGQDHGNQVVHGAVFGFSLYLKSVDEVTR